MRLARVRRGPERGTRKRAGVPLELGLAPDDLPVVADADGAGEGQADARVELADKLLTLHADSDFQLDQVYDIVITKLAKRNVDVRSLERGKVDKVSGNKVKQEVRIRAGIEQDLAKKIVRVIKDAKLKVQAAIQGDELRVSSKSRDDLQAVQALVKGADLDFAVQFVNYR